MRLLILIFLGSSACGGACCDIDETAPYVLQAATDAGDYINSACENIKQTLKYVTSEQQNSRGELPGCKARTAPCLVFKVYSAAAEFTDSIYQYFLEGTGMGLFATHWKREMQTIRSHYDSMLDALAAWTELREEQLQNVDPAVKGAQQLQLGYVNTEKTCIESVAALRPVLDRGVKVLQEAFAIIQRFGEMRPLDKAAGAVEAARNPSAGAKQEHAPIAHPTLGWLPPGVAEMLEEDDVDDMVAASLFRVISLVRELSVCIADPANVLCTAQQVEDKGDEVEKEFEDLGDMPNYQELQFSAHAPPSPRTSNIHLKQRLLALVHDAPQAAQLWDACRMRNSCSALQEENLQGEIPRLFVGIAQCSIQQDNKVGTDAPDTFNASTAAEALNNLAREADMKSKACAKLELQRQQGQDELQMQRQWQPKCIMQRLATAAAAELMLLLVMLGAWRGVDYCRSWQRSAKRRDDLHDMLLPVDSSTQSKSPSKMFFRMKPVYFTAFLLSVGLCGLVFQQHVQLPWHAESSQAVKEGRESSAYYAYWAMFARMASRYMKDMAEMPLGGNVNANENLKEIVPKLLERIAMMTPE